MEKILLYSKSHMENTHTVCGEYVDYIDIRGWAGLAQSELPLATCWTVRKSNPCGGKIFRNRPARPWGPPSLLYNGYQVFSRDKATRAWRSPNI